MASEDDLGLSLQRHDRLMMSNAVEPFDVQIGQIIVAARKLENELRTAWIWCKAYRSGEPKGRQMIGYVQSLRQEEPPGLKKLVNSIRESARSEWNAEGGIVRLVDSLSAVNVGEPSPLTIRGLAAHGRWSVSDHDFAAVWDSLFSKRPKPPISAMCVRSARDGTEYQISLDQLADATRVLREAAAEVGNFAAAMIDGCIDSYDWR